MTTYYVDSAATGTADGLSEANAWTTIDTAMNNVVAGDKVWVKASATYNELATMDTAGTDIAVIEFEGYTSTTGDNGKVTIDGTTQCIATALGSAYYKYKNFIFTGASAVGFGNATVDFLCFINCEFTSNGSHGVDCDNNCYFVNCVFANNTGRGLSADNETVVLGCIAYGNSDHAYNLIDALCFHKNVAYGVPSSKRGLSTTSMECGVTSCTFDGEGTGQYGVYSADSGHPSVVVDSIIYDWATTGIHTPTTLIDFDLVQGYNLLNSNTTDADLSGGTSLAGYGNVTGAPAFTDEAGDDYRPSSSSPAVDAQLKPGGIT